MTNAERFIGDEDLIDTFIDEFLDYIDRASKIGEPRDFRKTLINFFKQDVNVLTEDERIILRNLPKEYHVISRHLGDLQIKKELAFLKAWTDISEFNHLFKFVKERRRI